MMKIGIEDSRPMEALRWIVGLVWMTSGMLSAASDVEAAGDPEERYDIRESRIQESGPRRITIQRIANPHFGALKAEGGPEADGSAIPLAASREIVPTKPLMLSAVVVDGRASRLDWWQDGMSGVAWSNVNFNHFESLTHLDVAGVRYAVFMLITNISSSGLPADSSFRIPADLMPGAPLLRVEQGALDETRVGVLSALHDLYRQDGAKLRWAWEERMRTAKLRAAAEAQSHLEDKVPVVRYWKVQPKRNGGGE